MKHLSAVLDKSLSSEIVFREPYISLPTAYIYSVTRRVKRLVNHNADRK